MTSPDDGGQLEPGQALLVAASRNGGSLWLLDPKGHDANVNFVDRAVQSWWDAARALPRSIPLLARPFHALAGAVPRARHLASHVTYGHVIRERALDDTSFGLAFALSLASRATGVCLPCDLVASASVDAWGQLHPVGGLAPKAACLEAKARHVTRLLVAADQRDGIDEVEAAGLEVVRVRHLHEAINEVLPDIGAQLAAQARDPLGREALVTSLFRLAVDAPNEGLVTWRAVADAADHILAAGAGALDAWAVWRLEAARAFALRHTSPGVSPSCPWPPPLELGSLVPPPFRQYVAANLIQHATDCGSPDAEAILAWSEERGYFVRSQDAHLSELRVLGARARLWAVTGRPSDALAAQRDLTGAWLARGEVPQVTYTLGEWFRLAGALGDEAEYRAAIEAYQGARALGDLDEHHGEAFVIVEWARAASWLGHAPEATSALEQLSGSDGRIPGYLAPAVARVRARLARTTGDDGEAERLRESLGDGDEDAVLTARLIDLDSAVTRGDAARGADLVVQIAAQAPQTLAHLRRHRDLRSWPDEAAYIARFYPY